MFQPVTTDVVGEIIRTPGGAYVIRLRSGRVLPFTEHARTTRQADGSWRIEPLAEEIESDEVCRLLGVPDSTLRRIRDMGALEARLKSPGRYAYTLKAVLELKEKSRTDMEFWDRFRVNATPLQGALNLPA